MTHVLILGANGGIARVATELCLDKSVAALVVKLAMSPGLEIGRSLGVSKPE